MKRNSKKTRPLRVLIIWDSATGNTEWAVQKLKAYLIEQDFKVKLRRARDINKRISDVTDFDFIGLAYPVFAFKPMLTIMDAYRFLPPGAGKPVFLFHTNGGGPLGSTYYLGKKLFFKGYSVLCSCSIKMRDSWPVLRTLKYVSNHNEDLLPEAEEKIYEFSAKLHSIFIDFIHYRYDVRPLPKNRNPLNWVRIFYTKNFLKRFFPIKVNVKTCIKCGRCEEVCPTGRMKIENFPRPKGDCIGCYACINFCPTKSINSWFTKGKIRYNGPLEEVSND